MCSKYQQQQQHNNNQKAISIDGNNSVKARKMGLHLLDKIEPKKEKCTEKYTLKHAPIVISTHIWGAHALHDEEEGKKLR